MSRLYCCGSKGCERPRKLRGEALLWLSPESLPRWSTEAVCCGRGAEESLLASCDLHDGPDRVDNNLWLVDRDNVTGLLSRYQASSS